MSCQKTNGGIEAVFISGLNRWFTEKLTEKLRYRRVQKLKKLLSGVNNKKVL